MANSISNYIEPEYLEKYEVDYEILIRGGEPSPNVLVNLSRLQALVASNLIPPEVSPIHFSRDYEECVVTISNIQRTFQLNNSAEVSQQCRARLEYLYRRISRLNCLSDEQICQKNNLLRHYENVKQLFSARSLGSTYCTIDRATISIPTFLENFSKASPVSALTHVRNTNPFLDNTNPFLDNTNPFMEISAPPEKRHTTTYSQIEYEPLLSKNDYIPNPQVNPLHSNEPLFHDTEYPTSQRNKFSVPVFKWGISFSGREKGIEVVQFLERVNELQHARGVPLEDLFESAIDLFKEPALSWFRSIRHTVFSWPQLEQKMRDTFIPQNYDEDLLTEIKNRTQRPNESVVTFIAELRMKFRYMLVPIRLEEQVHIVRRNLIPFFVDSLCLQKIGSYEHLQRLCDQIIKNSANRNTEATSRIPQSRAMAMETTRTTRGSNPTNTGDRRPFNPQINCWNCRQNGHGYNTCEQPRRKFCFSCGFPNVYKSECPKCNPPRPGRQNSSKNEPGHRFQGASAVPTPSRPTEQTGAIPKVKPQ